MTPLPGTMPLLSQIPPEVGVFVVLTVIVLVALAHFRDRRRRVVRPDLARYALLRRSGKTPEEAREAMVRLRFPSNPTAVETAFRKFALAARPWDGEREGLVKMAVVLFILLEGEPSSVEGLLREMEAEIACHGLPGASGDKGNWPSGVD